MPLNLTRLFPQPAGFEATSQLRSYLVEFLFGAAVFAFCHCVSVFVSAACRVRSYLAAQLSRPTGEITAAPPAQAPVSEAPSWELAARAVITLLCSAPLPAVQKFLVRQGCSGVGSVQFQLRVGVVVWRDAPQGTIA